MYLLGLSDIIFAPVDSTFTLGAATRSFPPTPVFGHHSDLCQFFSSYELGADDKSNYHYVQRDLDPFRVCFTSDIDLDANLTRTFEALAHKADEHYDPAMLPGLHKDRDEKMEQYRSRDAQSKIHKQG
eukprot:CAMPEP_0197862268 /NCGR_PEP_ID=MMETSP1438-20131217/38916_1 /TAXON_ID=1461541 /ORGANISM="Pterosperma sp., Strain CCMP1384" /LENGTH=127 /DNA_ID=CAMNT_0043479777 /DNA_START=1 /DNA_END=384 /DNA_ORIENTATION=-